MTARRGRRAHRALKVLAGATALAVGAAAAALLLFAGPERPSQFAGKVEQLEARHMNPAPQGVVLLTGSSYFELWDTSARDLAGLETVNVGIGGTRVGDQIHYLDRLVVPFRPRALVVYAGSNDISGIPFFSRTADEVVPRVKDYVARVHAHFPGLPVYYVAITEAPIRRGVRGEIQEANRQLAAWARDTREITFIDTAPALLTPTGDIDGTLFRADRLHLNDAGYARFAAVIREVLVADLGG
ncbi:GDSL-type esterase/lipase family protein [Mariniluteicoccus flavus]